MSANQIPGPARERDYSVHSCSGCWRNGGAGHGLARLVVADSFGRRRAVPGEALDRRTLWMGQPPRVGVTFP